MVYGQYLNRPDSDQVDMYQFTLDQSGTVSVETLAQRLYQDGDSAGSLLDSVVSVYDSSDNLIAQNDNSLGSDSYLNFHLPQGTYYVAVSSAGNQFNPAILDSGNGGRTTGPYQLRLTFQPDRTAAEFITGANGMELDGATNGTAGTAYNYWFNVASTASTPAPGANGYTIFVNKSPMKPVSGPLGSITNPYTTLSAAATEAQKLVAFETSGLSTVAANAEIVNSPVVVQVLGDNTDNDFGGRGIQATAGSNITDGQVFTISNGTLAINFQFIHSGETPAQGNVGVTFSASDSAATVASEIATAISGTPGDSAAPLCNMVSMSRPRWILPTRRLWSSTDRRQLLPPATARWRAPWKTTPLTCSAAVPAVSMAWACRCPRARP